MYDDLDGLEVGGSRAGVDAWNEAVMAVHALRPTLRGHLDAAIAAEPGQVAARALRAVVTLPFGLGLDPLAELAAADHSSASERELSMLDATTIYVTSGPGVAAPEFVKHLQRWPLDTAASFPAEFAVVSSGRPELHQAMRAVAANQWALAPSGRTAHSEAMWLQEERRFAAAAAIASAALDEEPDSGLAVHVLTHCHYETGSHTEGWSWLDDWRTGREFGMYKHHFAWHIALHALALGDADTVIATLATELPDTAIPDVGSLRWRLRLAGLPSPERHDATAISVTVAAGRSAPQFSWWAALGAAAVGDSEWIRHEAERVSKWEMPAAAKTSRVLLALAAAAEDDWVATAIQLDGMTALNIAELGGSHAQREAIEDTRVAALVKLTRFDEARVLIEERLDRRPHWFDSTLLARCAR